MKKEMLINVLQPEEIRIAVLEDGVLEELYVERTSHESYVGNIYKGRIVNIEPSIQAAFVDFGVGRNGFLHISDVEPAYYRHLDGYGEGGRRSPRDRSRGERPQRGRPTMYGDEYDEFEDELPPAIVNDLRSADEPDDEPAADPYEAALAHDPRNDEDLAAPALDAEVIDREWPEDVRQPELDQEPWEKSESAIEAAEERIERELPPPLPPHATDPILPTPADPVGEVRSDEPTIESEEGGKRKSRTRSPRAKTPRAKTTRSRKTKSDDKPEEKADAEAPPPSAPDDDGPRFMSSAEHRGPGGDHAGKLDPLDDDDLSFSRRPTPAKPEPIVPAKSELFDDAETVYEDVELIVEDDGDDLVSIDELAPGAPPEPAYRETEREVLSVDEIEKAVEAGALGEDDEEDRVFIQELETPDHPPREREPEREHEDRPRDDRPRRDRGERGDRGDRGDRGGRGRGDRGDRGGRDRGDRGGRSDRGGDRGGRSGDRRRPPGRDSGRGGPPRPKPLIQDVFKRGQEVLVQVIKEGLGTKGPTLSTYISIAGRYLVLMPGLNRIGVSRKIEDDSSRRRLRDIMNELNPPKGLGFIIRTAGQDRNRKELQRDLMYLARLWKIVARRIRKQKSPCEIYQESDMVTRTIRDIFTSDIETIYVDEKNAYESAKEFLEVVMPRYADRIKFWERPEPMFHSYGIEQEIGRIHQRRVELPAGGSLVIDQTEALVAIDVNSGSFRADNNNAEENAYRMNLQAAREIARRLRLRDLGGVIVNDFIDMREERHRRGVERALREAVERDRARTKILRMSQFGIIQMTRQRIRPSLKRSVFHECNHCHGHGQVKTCESMSIDVMRLLQLALYNELIQRVEVHVHEEVAAYLLNRKRQEISRLEELTGKYVVIRPRTNSGPELLEFLCYDNNSHEVKFAPYEEPPRPPRRQGRGGRGRSDRGGDRGGRGDRGDRGDRGERRDRGDRGDRGERGGDRGGDRGRREERPRRDD